MAPHSWKEDPESGLWVCQTCDLKKEDNRFELIPNVHCPGTKNIETAIRNIATFENSVWNITLNTGRWLHWQERISGKAFERNGYIIFNQSTTYTHIKAIVQEFKAWYIWTDTEVHEIFYSIFREHVSIPLNPPDDAIFFT